jgi:RHS repeat-associated protein
VAQTSGSATTRSAQDLASPLSQVLQIGTTNYLYGMERLAAQTGSARTWYGADALGSVRQALTATRGTRASSYDSWGNRQQGLAFPFGFTGELHDSDVGLVNLRARWYDTRRGTFLTVDPFAGFAAQPYSQHPYQYAYSNPVRWTDPSGRRVIDLEDDGGGSCPSGQVWNPNRGACTAPAVYLKDYLAPVGSGASLSSDACGSQDVEDGRLSQLYEVGQGGFLSQPYEVGSGRAGS